MNPFVWRFMGGVATSMVIDRIIPDYYRHAAVGANLAIWGAATRRGKASELVGRQITRGTKAALRLGPRAMVRVGGRMVPVLGWMFLAYEAQQILHAYGVQGTDLFPPYHVDVNPSISIN